MAESVVISKGTDVVNVSITTAGEVNTGQNVGTGAQVFKEKVGADLRFRSVIGGTSITATQNANDITLDLPQEVATDSAVQFASVNINGQTTITWDNQLKTLTFPTNGVDVAVGQDLHTLVRNTTGVTIPKGKVVYITGSTGNKKTIALATNATEVASSTVFGVTEQAIENNADGFVITQGLVTGLATNTLTEGAAIWLDSTAGNITTTKPVSPAHLVLIGYCVSSAPSNGIIYVKVQNGYELEELHDVLITTPADNQTLAYDSATGLWKNQQLDISDFTDTTSLLNRDDLSNNTTTDLAEGTNLYYTQGRFDSAFSAKTTTDLTEGVNLYYTTARANTDFDTRLATKSTTDLAEGTNLYYTDARFDTRLATKSTTDLAEGTNLYYTDGRFDTRLATKTTDNLTEGSTNFYYTDARVKTLAGNFDGNIIPSADITYDLGSPTKQWRDVYIGPGSLYVNNKKVIEDDSGTITVETDPDQNLRVRTSGTGVTQITSAGAVQISATNSADIELTTATGNIELNGDVVIDATKSLNTSTGGALTVAAPLNLGSNDLTAQNVTVNGNLTVSGTTTTINTEELLVADNTVVLNSNYTGSTPSENAGIEIERGTLDNKILLWDETSDRWTVGAETFVAANFIGDLTGSVTGNVTGTVSTLSNHDTGDLAEGTNLYHTVDRVRNSISANFINFWDPAYPNGAIQYYPGTGVIQYFEPDIQGQLLLLRQDIDNEIANLTTSQIFEFENLYFTTARVDAHLNTNTATANQKLTWTGSDYSWTADASGIALTDLSVTTATEGIGAVATLEYNNTTGVFTFTPAVQATDVVYDMFNESAVTTDDLNEGVNNLYYTNTRVNSWLDSKVTILNLQAITQNDITGSESTFGGLVKQQTSPTNTTLVNYVPAPFDPEGYFYVTNLDEFGVPIDPYTIGERGGIEYSGGQFVHYSGTSHETAIDARVTKSFVENLDIDIDGGTY